MDVFGQKMQRRQKRRGKVYGGSRLERVVARAASPTGGEDVMVLAEPAFEIAVSRKRSEPPSTPQHRSKRKVQKIVTSTTTSSSPQTTSSQLTPSGSGSSLFHSSPESVRFDLQREITTLLSPKSPSKAFYRKVASDSHCPSARTTTRTDSENVASDTEGDDQEAAVEYVQALSPLRSQKVAAAPSSFAARMAPRRHPAMSRLHQGRASRCLVEHSQKEGSIALPTPASLDKVETVPHVFTQTKVYGSGRLHCKAPATQENIEAATESASTRHKKKLLRDLHTHWQDLDVSGDEDNSAIESLSSLKTSGEAKRFSRELDYLLSDIGCSKSTAVQSAAIEELAHLAMDDAVEDRLQIEFGRMPGDASIGQFAARVVAANRLEKLVSKLVTLCDKEGMEAQSLVHLSHVLAELVNSKQATILLSAHRDFVKSLGYLMTHKLARELIPAALQRKAAIARNALTEQREKSVRIVVIEVLARVLQLQMSRGLSSESFLLETFSLPWNAQASLWQIITSQIKQSAGLCCKQASSRESSRYVTSLLDVMFLHHRFCDEKDSASVELLLDQAMSAYEQALPQELEHCVEVAQAHAALQLLVAIDQHDAVRNYSGRSISTLAKCALLAGHVLLPSLSNIASAMLYIDTSTLALGVLTRALEQIPVATTENLLATCVSVDIRCDTVPVLSQLASILLRIYRDADTEEVCLNFAACLAAFLGLTITGPDATGSVQEPCKNDVRNRALHQVSKGMDLDVMETLALLRSALGVYVQTASQAEADQNKNDCPPSLSLDDCNEDAQTQSMLFARLSDRLRTVTEDMKLET